MNYAQITYATEVVSCSDGKVQIRKETADGYDVLEAALPVVVSVTKTPFELRFPTVKKRLAANRAQIPMMSASTIVGFYLAYALLGVGFGATNCVYPVAITKSFGPKYAGNLYGTGMLAYMVYGTLITPAIVSTLVANSGNYSTSFIYAIVLKDRKSVV